MSARVLIIVALALGAVLGTQAWNAHLVAKGDAQGAQRVRTEWETADAKREGDEATARRLAAQQQAQKEREARAKEVAKQQEAERIAREQAERDVAQRAALAAADARNRSLHTTIAQLNADSAARMSSSSTGACTTADIDAAATARTALGQCSSRYTAVAGVADQLAGQVAGLQSFVLRVVGSGQTQERGADGS